MNENNKFEGIKYGRAYLNSGLLVIIVFMAIYWGVSMAILFGSVVLLSNLIYDLYKYQQWQKQELQKSAKKRKVVKKKRGKRK